MPQRRSRAQRAPVARAPRVPRATKPLRALWGRGAGRRAQGRQQPARDEGHDAALQQDEGRGHEHGHAVEEGDALAVDVELGLDRVEHRAHAVHLRRADEECARRDQQRDDPPVEDGARVEERPVERRHAPAPAPEPGPSHRSLRRRPSVDLDLKLLLTHESVVLLLLFRPRGPPTLQLVHLALVDAEVSVSGHVVFWPAHDSRENLTHRASPPAARRSSTKLLPRGRQKRTQRPDSV